MMHLADRSLKLGHSVDVGIRVFNASLFEQYLHRSIQMMAATSAEADTSKMGPTGLIDPAVTFEKMQDLLRAKDDTSRFVGLALLKTVLDNGQIVQDPGRLQMLWESLSP